MHHIDYIEFESDDNFRKAKIIAMNYGNSIKYKYQKAKEIPMNDKAIK